MRNLCQTYSKMASFLETYGEPIALLLVRLQVASFFWKAGKTKLDDYLHANGEGTLELFREIHPVPGLSAEIAAPMAMLSEVSLSVLLVLGLCSRGVALALLGVCGVIYITHQANLDSIGEFIELPWLVPLLLIILVRGAGLLSADKLASIFVFKSANAPSIAE